MSTTEKFNSPYCGGPVTIVSGILSAVAIGVADDTLSFSLNRLTVKCTEPGAVPDTIVTLVSPDSAIFGYLG